MSEGSAVVGEVGGESENMSERQLLVIGEEGEGGVEGGVIAIVHRYILIRVAVRLKGQ